MKYIITILCFLGTTLCNDLVSIQVVGNDSRWFIWKVRKVKTRVIEVTYLDGTIIKNPTELIEIKRKQWTPFKYMFQSIFIFILLWSLVGD